MFGWRQLCRICHQLAISQLAIGTVKDRAGLGAAGRGVRIPSLGGSCDQHGPGGSAGLTELLKAGPYTGASPGHLHTECRVVVFGIDGSRFKANLRPVGIEFLGQQHRQRGKNALAHLGVVHDHGDLLVSSDAHKGVGHEGICGCLRGCLHAGSWKVETNQQAAACGNREFEEFAARDNGAATRTADRPCVNNSRAHLAPSLATVPAARWMARRMRG